MTIDLRITTLDPVMYGPENEQIEKALRSLGFVREHAAPYGADSIEGHRAANPDLYRQVAEELNPVEVPDEPITQAEAEAIVQTAKRERGKPSPGRARRTKEEIAEDEAADKADAEAIEAETQAMADKATGVAAISTGEARVDPDNPEDVAQDEADEAADAAVSNGGKLTHDNLRDVMATYVKAYGLPAAQEDVPKVFAGLFGEGVVKVSQVPEDRIADAIEAVKKAGRENTYGRTALPVAA